MTSAAIIGAGLAGLVVAQRLQSLVDVAVFEKSRGVGGRMATRYAGEFEFDHGAQFFTAQTDAFRRFLQPLIDDGVVANWRSRFAELDRDGIQSSRRWGDDLPHFVGVPRMNVVGKALSAGLNIASETEITAIERTNAGWNLTDAGGESAGPFDWLVMTCPAAQTAALAQAHPDLLAFCDDRRMLGCYALMLGFDAPVNLPWQAALVRHADISWMSVNSSKPGRKPPVTLVVHSTNAWADQHLDEDVGEALAHLLDEASRISGADLDTAVHRQLHRWRYANIAQQNGPRYFLNEDDRLAACGDWCVRGRIEAAFTSASELAGSIANKLRRAI